MIDIYIYLYDDIESTIENTVSYIAQFDTSYKLINLYILKHNDNVNIYNTKNNRLCYSEYVLDLKTVLKYNCNYNGNYKDLLTAIYLNNIEFDNRYNDLLQYNNISAKYCNETMRAIDIKIKNYIVNKYKVISDIRKSLQNIATDIETSINTNIEQNKYYNEILIPTFANIERNIISYVDNDGNIVKCTSQYNIYTMTGRPWSRMIQIPLQRFILTEEEKKDGYRLFYFDFDGYHLRLLSKLIGYDIPYDVVAHDYVYNTINSDNNIDKDEKKKTIFKLLYSENGITEDIIKKSEFFRKVYEYAENIYRNRFVFRSPLTNIKIYKPVFENNRKMLMLNYLLQRYETDNNVMFINRLPEYIRNNILVYRYDGFLIRYKNKEIDNLINIIKSNVDIPIRYTIFE